MKVRWVRFPRQPAIYCGVFALCVLLTAGCGADTPGGGADTSPATGSGADPAAAAGGEVVRDDFSDPASGWRQYENSQQGAGYEGGSYVVWADNDASSYVGASGRYEARELTDTRLEVQATKLSGPEGAPIGLSCRQWSDGDRHGVYFADIDAEGEARLGLYDEDGQEILAETERSGLWRDGANALRLDCIGDELRFFINGEQVLEASNDRFARGRVGVRAGGTSSGVTRVAFDDAVITIIGS